MKRSFASDNNAPVHPLVMQAIINANQEDYVSYGDDPFTLEAEELFEQQFGKGTLAYFVFNGTGANVTGISHLIRPYHSIICSSTAHIHHDECGAPEKISGSKVITLPSTDGKISIKQIEPLLHSKGFQHHAQPRLISITQCTELGMLYTADEIREIAQFAHQNDLLLHLDGARIANACAALGLSFREMVSDTGVDILSFGGTKNGLMMGEAVVFLNPGLAHEFQYHRKQTMQLASKMRYLSAQFIPYFKDDLWLKTATHANAMALLLAERIRSIPQVKLTMPVQTNAVFAAIPPKAIKPLQDKYFFYVWNESLNEVRWMTHFATQAEDIEDFVQTIKEVLQ